jgi:hypothetical protein
MPIWVTLLILGAYQNAGKFLLRRLFLGNGNCLICDGTVFNAAATAGTEVRVDTAGPFINLNLEVPGRTLYRFDVCITDYLNI